LTNVSETWTYLDWFNQYLNTTNNVTFTYLDLTNNANISGNITVDSGITSTNNMEIWGNYYLKWLDNTGTNTYAYIIANTDELRISATDNNPMTFRYGSLGSNIGATMNGTTGDWSFENNINCSENITARAFHGDGGNLTNVSKWQVLSDNTAILLDSKWSVSIGENSITSYKLLVNGTTNLQNDINLSLNGVRKFLFDVSLNTIFFGTDYGFDSPYLSYDSGVPMLTFFGGNALTSGVDGGKVLYQGGSGKDAGNGGEIEISAGDGGTSGNGGNVMLTSGSGGGHGTTSGDVLIQTSTGIAGITPGNIWIDSNDGYIYIAGEGFNLSTIAGDVNINGNDSFIYGESFFGDGGNLTNISAGFTFNDWFNQQLNTTNNVTFTWLDILNDINVSGFVNASYFIGDGGNLTNISGSFTYSDWFNQNLNTTNNATFTWLDIVNGVNATYFSGDGGNLTNLTGAINGSSLSLENISFNNVTEYNSHGIHFLDDIDTKNITLSGKIDIDNPPTINAIPFFNIEGVMGSGVLQGMRFSLDQPNSGTISLIVDGIFNDKSAGGNTLYGMRYNINDATPKQTGAYKNYVGYFIDHTPQGGTAGNINIWDFYSTLGGCSHINSDQNITAISFYSIMDAWQVIGFPEDKGDLNLYGMYVQSPSFTVMGTVTGDRNVTGIYLEDMNPTGATNGTAIHTNGGEHIFGDDVNVSGNVNVTGITNTTGGFTLPLSIPTTPEAGSMYLDAANATLAVYDGTLWRWYSPD